MSQQFATASRFMVSVFMTTVIGCLAVGMTARNSLWDRVRRNPGDAGMSTAEYAVGTIAACAFAAVLYQVVTGDSIVAALRDLITSALTSLS